MSLSPIWFTKIRGASFTGIYSHPGQGQYDFILIADMPDAQTASVNSLVTGSGGGIQDMMTSRAFAALAAEPRYR